MRTPSFPPGQVVQLAEPAVLTFESGRSEWLARGEQVRVLSGVHLDRVKVADHAGRKGLVRADCLEPVVADPDDDDGDRDDPEPHWDTGEPVGKRRKHRRPDLPATPLLKELIRAGLLRTGASLTR